MDFSAFRSLKPSSWRSKPSDTVSTSHTDAQKKITNSIVTTSEENTKHSMSSGSPVRLNYMATLICRA